MGRDYGECFNEQKIWLEAKFTGHLMSGEADLAYETLGELMSYKMLEKDDSRLSPKYKLLKAKTYSDDHRFPYDYRKEYNFLPQSIMFKSPWVMVIHLTSQEHWGKRVEGNYSGDVVVPAVTLKYTVKLVTTASEATQVMGGIQQLYKTELDKTIKTTNIIDGLLSGEVKAYSINLASDQHALARNLGYAIVTESPGIISVKLVLDHESLKKNTINAIDAYKVVTAAFLNNLGGAEHKVKVSSFCNLKELREKVEAEEARRKELEEGLYKSRSEAMAGTSD